MEKKNPALLFMCDAGYSVQSYKKPSVAQGTGGYLLHAERFQLPLQPRPQPVLQLLPFLTRCLQLHQGLLHLLHLLNVDLLLLELKREKEMQNKLNNENEWTSGFVHVAEHRIASRVQATAVSEPQVLLGTQHSAYYRFFPSLLGIFVLFVLTDPIVTMGKLR